MLYQRDPKQSRKRIYEHKLSIKLDDDRNAFFYNILDLKQTFNFPQATQIKPINCKISPRLLQSAAISKTKYIQQRPRFNQIPSFLADIMLHENNIEIENGQKLFSKIFLA